MLTEKDYCDYETCVALKELGYKGISRFFYATKESPLRRYSYDQILTTRIADTVGHTLAISLYVAQKWLREEKEFYVFVGREWENAYYYWLSKKVEDKTVGITHSFYYSNEEGQFSSYEEALSEGIKEAVKILKEK